MNMTQTRLYSTQTCKNRVGFVSCSRVVSNFASPNSMVGTTLTIERELGFEVETLKKPLYVSSPLGIRARIWMIC